MLAPVWRGTCSRFGGDPNLSNCFGAFMPKTALKCPPFYR